MIIEGTVMGVQEAKRKLTHSNGGLLVRLKSGKTVLAKIGRDKALEVFSRFAGRKIRIVKGVVVLDAKNRVLLIVDGKGARNGG